MQRLFVKENVMGLGNSYKVNDQLNKRGIVLWLLVLFEYTVF